MPLSSLELQQGDAITVDPLVTTLDGKMWYGRPMSNPKAPMAYFPRESVHVDTGCYCDRCRGKPTYTLSGRVRSQTSSDVVEETTNSPTQLGASKNVVELLKRRTHRVDQLEARLMTQQRLGALKLVMAAHWLHQVIYPNYQHKSKALVVESWLAALSSAKSTTQMQKLRTEAQNNGDAVARSEAKLIQTIKISALRGFQRVLKQFTVDAIRRAVIRLLQTMSVNKAASVNQCRREASLNRAARVLQTWKMNSINRAFRTWIENITDEDHLLLNKALQATGIRVMRSVMRRWQTLGQSMAVSQWQCNIKQDELYLAMYELDAAKEAAANISASKKKQLRQQKLKANFKMQEVKEQMQELESKLASNPRPSSP